MTFRIKLNGARLPSSIFFIPGENWLNGIPKVACNIPAGNRNISMRFMPILHKCRPPFWSPRQTYGAAISAHLTATGARMAIVTGSIARASREANGEINIPPIKKMKNNFRIKNSYFFSKTLTLGCFLDFILTARKRIFFHNTRKRKKERLLK